MGVKPAPPGSLTADTFLPLTSRSPPAPLDSAEPLNYVSDLRQSPAATVAHSVLAQTKRSGT
jgi:hypothetical protein